MPGGSSIPTGATAAAPTPDLPTLPCATVPQAVPSAVAFESLEGPHWVATGGYLLFSDVVEANGPGAKIYRLDPASRQISVLPYPAAPAASTTSTNGLAVDGHGKLIACERHDGRVVRLDDATHLAVLADRWPAHTALPPGKRLNATNDLAVRPDGNIYFTDSDWGVAKAIEPGVEHAAMGVYRIDPTGALSRVFDVQKPNGIALSPDGASLYVGSDTQAKVWRLPLDAQGQAGVPALFIDGKSVPGGFAVPDGICVDDAGDLFVTNNDDALKSIVVFDASGRPKARIRFPFRPSNCSFGGADRRTLYVTTLHAIYELQTPMAGQP